MIRHLSPRPWFCSGCAKQWQVTRGALAWRQRRTQVTIADSAIPRPSPGSKFGKWGRIPLSTAPVFNRPSDASDDDALLRQLFDSFSAWHHFAKPKSGQKPTGLFRNAYLTSPEGFIRFAHTSMAKATVIVQRVLAMQTKDEYRRIVKDLDRLSDLLCRVIDMCDFVRVTHPSGKIQDAATEAWTMMYEYMNQLNTMTGLNDQLGIAMEDPQITASWSEEEQTVAKILKQDFMKSAVNLPQSYRDKFVQLSQSISEVGTQFVNELAPEKYQLSFPSSQLRGMDPTAARKITSRGTAYMPTMGYEAALALGTVHDRETRKAIWCARRTASKESIKTLETLIELRAEIATLAGFESYADMALRDRMMAKSPNSVQQFLLALSEANKPLAQRERDELLREREKQGHAGDEPLKPWDESYYIWNVQRNMIQPTKRQDELQKYFSLGTVMQGLSRLFTRLYGIRLVPREPLEGETWHPDVRRLDVVSDTDGLVAVLYCDLFYRRDKSPNPAHFTVRCAREIQQSEVQEAQEQLEAAPEASGVPIFDTAAEAANDGMALSARNGPLRQLPTIALICDFAFEPGFTERPAFLNLTELETLFHEMGHAVHSILGQTSLQNVAGTRCATDLAELPSTLMEHFADDPSVLGLFARHIDTDKPLDTSLVAERLRSANYFKGCEDENQILMAMLDQAYHGPRDKNTPLDSTRVYHALQAAHGGLGADPPETRWQGFFGHLNGYGSTYYSYLFDRVLAERVWRVVFDGGRDHAALSRERGEHLRNSLLKWGGSRDPWRCLADALRDERVAGGDEKAMALVGSWGTNSGAKDGEQQ